MAIDVIEGSAEVKIRVFVGYHSASKVISSHHACKSHFLLFFVLCACLCGNKSSFDVLPVSIRD